MSEDPRAEGQVAEATADEAETEGEEKPPKKLSHTVEIRDAGPCRKHIKVAIPRTDIDERLNNKFSEMVVDSTVPGYRPGKAPRKLIEKRFYKDVSEQLKAELLLQSLEQLAEENNLAPIAQPNLDPFKIEIPKEGPMEYEFEVEVAPEFELPDYKGLKINRPIREFTDEDVEKAERRFLMRFGTLVPKDGPAELEDYLVTDMVVRLRGQQIGKHSEMTVRIDPQLAFKDGVIKDFGEKVKGVKAGETRELEILLSPIAASPNLRGQTVQATFDVKEVKRLRLPELTHEFLHRLDLHTPEQLREKIRVSLKRQLEYEQRKSAREQVLQHITAASAWELPPDLLRRQAQKVLNRRVMEMRNAGFPEEEINARAAMLRQDALNHSERSLKEHFVLQKVAEVEKIEVSDEDVDFEIEMMAAQTNESPRRVRARLEKEDMMDVLETEVLERKALDLVLDSAEYEDVAYQPEAATGAVEEQAVPGAEPEYEPEPEKPAEAEEEQPANP